MRTKAADKIQVFVGRALAALQGLRRKEHARAAFFLLNSEVRAGALNFSQGQLPIAATMIVAELRTSRSRGQMYPAAFISELPNAANSRATGWRQNGQLGLVSSVSAADCFDSVISDSYFIAHNG